MIKYSLFEIFKQRHDQMSFHMASEKALRIEFMRFLKDQSLGPFKYNGDLAITCLNGIFHIGNEDLKMELMDQVIVPNGEYLKLICVSDEGNIQIIWTPPFAQVAKGEA